MRGASLIVLAWNQWALTRRCLDTLLESDLDEAEIIVVDNGSSDATPAQLAGYADRVRIVRLAENFGYVRGMNAGIAAARDGNDVVLLNNDLVFTQRDWLNRLRDSAYADAAHGVVGCRMRGPAPEHLIYHLGGFIEPETLWGQQTESGQQESEVGQFRRDRRVQCVAFALAYIRRDCLQRIGALDEIFHSYFEDTDYCLRAADAGIASVVSGGVTLVHDQHGSTRDDGGFRERLWKASREKFAARWQQRLVDNYRGTVLWQGLSRQPHAYAQLTHDLLWRLDSRDLRMAYAPVAAELLDGGDFRLELAARRMLPALPEVALVCAPGQWQAAAQGRFRVLLAFSEWRQPPAAWIDHCNRFDRLVLPDAYQAEAFRAAGVTAPIEIVPLGIDREYCHPDVPVRRHPQGRFVFLCVAEEHGRDAPDQVIAAFRRSFRADDPVELIVHVRPGNGENAIREIVEALAADTASASVRILAGWGFPAHQRAQLLVAADAYVSARRGAGWDPLVGEAIACGRVVVAPAYGSQRELVREWGLEVDLRGEVEDPGQPGCLWADPDLESLAWRMRDAYERRGKLLAQSSSRAAEFSARHNVDASADRLAEILASGSTLKPARMRPPPHRPGDAGLAACGQIVVLGMHRSGTSSVGGLLDLFGAFAGADALLLRGPDNPRGHFEHAELHMACVRRLQSAGGDWKNPPVDSPARAIDAFRREVAAVLETLEPARPWFIKEPRLCLLVRELLPLLSRPVFVHVVRDPLATAASLQRRDGMALADALALWERYTRDAFAATSGWSRLIVDYDALCERPVATARTLFDTLAGRGVAGLAFPGEAAIRAWIEPAETAMAADACALSATQAELRAAIRERRILGPRPGDA
ncbi:MAG TPA: glycosyltransferase [Dokdonella sp.]|nr:glycosyltransferase [Dokdonella sp.]